MVILRVILRVVLRVVLTCGASFSHFSDLSIDRALAGGASAKVT